MIIILYFLTLILAFILGCAVYHLSMYTKYLELKILIEKNEKIRAKYYEYFENIDRN